MRSHIHHVALNVEDLDWYAAFFREVFGMQAERTAGERPGRKLWFREGIQLNEVSGPLTGGGWYDHLSLAVEDIPDTVKSALSRGCSPLPEGRNWFALPNGVRVELKELTPQDS